MGEGKGWVFYCEEEDGKRSEISNGQLFLYSFIVMDVHDHSDESRRFFVLSKIHGEGEHLLRWRALYQRLIPKTIAVYRIIAYFAIEGASNPFKIFE